MAPSVTNPVVWGTFIDLASNTGWVQASLETCALSKPVIQSCCLYVWYQNLVKPTLLVVIWHVPLFQTRHRRSFCAASGQRSCAPVQSRCAPQLCTCPHCCSKFHAFHWQLNQAESQCYHFISSLSQVLSH